MELEQPALQDSDLPDTSADSDPHSPNPTGDAELEDGAGVDPPEEEDEIEVDGRKFALPKSAAEKIKAGLMKDADYTQKTQAVAAERQAVEAERAEVAKVRETHQQFVKEVARVEALTDQLALYDKVDWQALIADNPQDAMLYQEQRRQVEAQLHAAKEAVTQKQQQFALDEQQSFAKQVQQAEAYVQREIPGWTAERSDQLMAFAQAQGVKIDQATAKMLVANPALLKVFHQAEKYSQLEKKQSAKPAPAEPPKPATRVTAARPGAARDPNKMGTAEWMEHRNKQLTSKR